MTNKLTDAYRNEYEPLIRESVREYTGHDFDYLVENIMIRICDAFAAGQKHEKAKVAGLVEALQYYAYETSDKDDMIAREALAKYEENK